jgi:nucleotide-binding universal stress UspA family protein
VWHKQQRRRKRLFRTVLVALEGIPEDEVTLAQALLVAGWEKSRVNGVHLCEYDYQLEAADGDTVATLFKSQLAQAGLEGELVSVYEEDEARPIIDRARWSDLVVVSLTNPPGPDMSGRRGNLFIRLIQQSPRPILAVSGKRSPLDHALVAYDGSPKADEALFLAARAAQRWESALTVLTVTTQHTSGEALDAARAYLEECRVEANYVLREQHIADAILAVSAELGCDWLIMGGFGFRPMRHLMLGSTVDRMLREFPDPILICR